MKSISQKSLPFLVLLAAAALLYAGARMIPAGIASYQAEAFIGAWEQGSGEPAPRAWQIAHEAGQRAIELYPAADGDRLDRLGRIHSWQQFRQPYGQAEAEPSRRAALAAYRASVAARPNWPYSWARLAHAKLYLQEFDAEFHQALSEALRLGPWRIGVNRELVEIGFSAWPHLDKTQRQAIEESARRVAEYGAWEAKHLLRIAEHTGRVAELCASLSLATVTSRQLTPCLDPAAQSDP